MKKEWCLLINSFYKNFLKHSILFFIVVMVSIKIYVFILARQSYFLFFDGRIINDYIQIILTAFIIILIIIKLIIVSSRVSKFLLFLFCIIAISNIINLFNLSENDPRYFLIESPNKKISLVVEEKSFLFSGMSNFYLKTSNHFLKKLNKEIFTDDGYRPFLNNDYEVIWKEDEVIIIYTFEYNVMKSAISIPLDDLY